MEKTAYRSGFVSIIGSPNVGKSTLLNQLVGQKVSIVSSKSQTTRNRIMGVLSKPGFQMVFIDTPGVMLPRNRLGEYMVHVAYESLSEVDAVLFMTDALQGIREKDEALIERLRSAKAPVIAAINKTDKATPDVVERMRNRLLEEWFVREIHEISALQATGTEALIAGLLGYLSEGPQYFPENMVTDQPERLICAEFIREKALELLREEIPHGLGVSLDKMALREDQPDGAGLYDVWATIYCERSSHKGIIIGKNGGMLKRIGSQARADMEWLLGVRVNLQLWVKVKEDWRNSVSVLRELGYSE